MGKSCLVTNIAENAAISHGLPVALFSLEMSEAELARRFIASQASVHGEDLSKGRVPEASWPKIVKASSRLADAPLWVDDSGDIGMLEIRAKARRLYAKSGGLGLVIVDYLQLLRAESRSENRAEIIGQMSRGLKMLARELDVPVVALSQLNRSVESRNPKIPMLSDLRESGAVEQDADVVIFIYRDDYYHNEKSETPSTRPGEADLIIAKNRNGPVGNVILTFRPEYPRFMNYSGSVRVSELTYVPRRGRPPTVRHATVRVGALRRQRLPRGQRDAHRRPMPMPAAADRGDPRPLARGADPQALPRDLLRALRRDRHRAPLPDAGTRDPPLHRVDRREPRRRLAGSGSPAATGPARRRSR